jgi:tetratricopeptide (TPR) repeat protein
VRARIGLLGKAAALATVLLLGPCIYPPVAAQTAGEGQRAKPAPRKAKASTGYKAAPKSRTPPSPEAADRPAERRTARKTPAKPAKLLDPAKLDPLRLGASDALQVDPGRLDPKSPNTWLVVGLVEGVGGNIAGAKESLERAIALGERRNKVVAAAAAIVLGRVRTIGLNLIRVDAGAAASFGGTPSKDTTDFLDGEFKGIKGLFEKTIALCSAAGRKDGMATGYALLGDLYSRNTDYEEAQAAIGKALALNKALGNKKGLAANYRALADTNRYDLDQAETLLKEAVGLHKSLGLDEELATDYEKLGAINKIRGEPYEAERLYKQALALTPRVAQGRVLRALQQLYRDRDDPGQAAEMEEQASAIGKEQQSGGRLYFSSDLGLYRSSVAVKAQTEALEKAVPLEKKVGHWVGLATSYTLLGMHYSERARLEEETAAVLSGRAEAMMRESLALNRTLGRELAVAHVYRELASIIDNRGDVTAVDEILKDAYELHKKLGKEADMARLYSSLAYGRSRRGDKAQECDYWRKGATAFPEQKDLVDALNRCGKTQ